MSTEKIELSWACWARPYLLKSFNARSITIISIKRPASNLGSHLIGLLTTS
nr:hypothetical protein [Candidatus Sigynarchaeum springense]